jgi:hypothetical protein
MQIQIRLVCPDPNYNRAKILDPDSMNPDPKHSYRYVPNFNKATILDPDSMNPDPKHSYTYVPICGSRRTDELSRYRYLYGFLVSRCEILEQVCTVRVQFSGSGFNECRSK